MIGNTDTQYGLLHVVIHWLVAATVFGLFAVGFWMVGLDYYNPWYKTAPFYHKSAGILLFLVMVFRVIWVLVQPKPMPIESHKPWEQRAAKMVHWFLYLVLFIIMLSGYFISTADGRGIEVFSWFEVPAIFTHIENQEDIAGVIHKWVAYIMIAMVLLHVAAALKHHFIEKDNTLIRMFGKN